MYLNKTLWRLAQVYSITDKLILRIMIIVGLVLTTGSGAALEAQGGWLLAAEGGT